MVAPLQLAALAPTSQTRSACHEREEAAWEGLAIRIDGLTTVATLGGVATDDGDLDRFVRAQDCDGNYPQALAELEAGRKTGHWIWYVFPQIAGLGSSSNAVLFSLSSLSEAADYLDHPVLGPRLRSCAEALLGLDTSDPVAVLGSVDAKKLRSSMTLFHRARPDEQIVVDVLDRFFSGHEDPLTLSLLRG